MFESPLFDHAISHRFALTKVMRQSVEDREFLKALSEIRFGQCSNETETYLCSLSRELPRPLTPKGRTTATDVENYVTSFLLLFLV